MATFEIDPNEIILDSIADGVFTVDLDWRITTFNRAAEEITGVSREDAIGSRCCDVFHASICESGCALRRTFETGQPVLNQAIYVVNARGDQVPISISAAVLRDKAGKIIGGVETFRDLSAIENLRRQLERRYSFHDIISKNKEMLGIFDVLPSVAESDSTVLIEGETGTGKELIARAMHQLSHRQDKPFVAVNCGALPDTLLESELFGYKAGAFTDARKDKPGRFALADTGTLFLDEIADISPALQVRLLRAIQDGTYEPLGATRSVTSDIRFIAASNKNLDELVASGEFRQDLFFRLNVIRFRLPPLRERPEDIPLLVDHFIRRFNHSREKYIADITPAALAALAVYRFPGNIRELENVIERAFVLCPGTTIGVDCLPETIVPEAPKTPTPATSMDDIEAAFIVDALNRHGWNRTETARELGIHKTTLWRKMKRLRISR